MDRRDVRFCDSTIGPRNCCHQVVVWLKSCWSIPPSSRADHPLFRVADHSQSHCGNFHQHLAGSIPVPAGIRSARALAALAHWPKTMLRVCRSGLLTRSAWRGFPFLRRHGPSTPRGVPVMCPWPQCTCRAERARCADCGLVAKFSSKITSSS